MTVDTNGDTRHCCELGKNPEAFLKEAEMPDFKVFLLWVMNNHKRIGAASSLKNYWRVLRMHILDKTGRVFNESDRRDIRNVRYIFGTRGNLTDYSIPHSISKISRSSSVSVHSRWKNRSQVAMICIFGSIPTGSLMIQYFRMSVNGFSIPQGYLWADFSVADCAPSSIPESSLSSPTSMT